MTQPQQPGWRKSTRSAASGACVEIRPTEGGVEVRDSKHPDRVLFFGAQAWRAFVDGTKTGEFDDSPR